MANIEHTQQPGEPTTLRLGSTTSSTAEHAIARAIQVRHSTRAFKPTPIPPSILEECLELAQQHSPSNSNLQPWRLTVVEGPALTRLSNAILEAESAGVMPAIKPIPQSYKHYRSELGHILYGKEGYNIPREAKEAKRQAERRNYQFFDAPTGIIVCMENDLAPCDSLSIGLYLQILCLLLQERGIGNCIEVSVAGYPDVIRRELGIGEDMLVLCGVAVGYEDEDQQINHLKMNKDEWKMHVNFVRE